MKIITAIKIIESFLLSYSGSKNAKFLNAGQTIDEVIENRYSLIRYGDGEFNYIVGKNVHYQKYDSRLQGYLDKILKEYLENQIETRYMVCMPGNFLSCKGKFIIKQKRYLISWSFARRIFMRKYDSDVTYGDAFCFAAENTDIYEKLWNVPGIGNIILVHNNIEYLEQLQKVCNKKCSFIEIPSKNAFENFDSILNRIIEAVQEKGKKDTMVVLSAGPCAKALVYELVKHDIWAIDSGHCFCKPLHIMED